MYLRYKSHVLGVQGPCTRSTKSMYCGMYVKPSVLYASISVVMAFVIRNMQILLPSSIT